MWDPYDPVSYFAHVVFGFAAVAGAVTALSVTKGSPLHKRGGWFFVIPMTVAALTAFVFEAQFDQPRPLAIIMAVATLYLLATSMLALRNKLSFAPIAEKVLVIVPLALLVQSVIFLVRSISIGSWATVPGPVLYGGVFLALVIGDIKLMRSRPTERLYWVKRHLLRILLAFAFAVRALFSLGIETGIPFEVVVTTPLVLALLAAWYFFRQLDRP
ncbi:MAG: hypothetical protein QNJ00_17240 [Woeseiaceae bacterium]|nr:hypothetical protein [Woeseiaceae bacterium]